MSANFNDIIFQSIDELRIFQCRELINWISETGELYNISGLRLKTLDYGTLGSWIDNAYDTRVALLEDKIVGIATLSQREAKIDNKAIEICHLIIHPNYRRHYWATNIVAQLTAIAKKDGFHILLARVVTNNTPALSLFNNLNWQIIRDNKPTPDPSVIWYNKEIQQS